MSEQPEALRLADAIDYPDVLLGNEAAAELRRLHEVNAELLEACKQAEWHSLDLPKKVIEQLQAAIAKATGEQNGKA